MGKLFVCDGNRDIPWGDESLSERASDFYKSKLSEFLFPIEIKKVARLRECRMVQNIAFKLGLGIHLLSYTGPMRKGRQTKPVALAKATTGIRGLDEITLGGLPRGRPTLVCGSAGCGKTLFGMEFLIRGALQFGEPGVCMTFEERTQDLVQNVASLGFDLQKLMDSRKIVVDHVHLDRSQIEETGDYDLEGLFVRLNHAIDSIGAKRVVLDTIEALFSGLSNENVLRAELRRLFLWLKQKGVTAVITGEKGDGTLTRRGLEEYVSDCVILLDHRVSESVSTRRLRVVKYRGSTHGTNEIPFMIDEHGFSVLPLSSAELKHKTSSERFSSGIPDLDDMLGGKGFFRGSSILISGTSGTGKTTLSASIANAACARGEKVAIFTFEESRDQVVRNMRSVGLDLEPWFRKNLLFHHASRPTMFGLEAHLVRISKVISEVKPSMVVLDPVSCFLKAGDPYEAQSSMLRMVDMLKERQITGIFNNLVSAAHDTEETELSISSLIDTWILLRDIEISGERNRGIYILKSRGMAHSNQIREFILNNKGIHLREAYLGPAGVLTGSARVALEASEKAGEIARQQTAERQKQEHARKIKAIEMQIALLQGDLLAARREMTDLASEEQKRETAVERARFEMMVSRGAGREKSPNGGRGLGGVR